VQPGAPRPSGWIYDELVVWFSDPANRKKVKDAISSLASFAWEMLKEAWNAIPAGVWWAAAGYIGASALWGGLTSAISAYVGGKVLTNILSKGMSGAASEAASTAASTAGSSFLSNFKSVFSASGMTSSVSSSFSTLGGAAGSAMAVAAAAYAGYQFGTWLDEKFGLSDKIADKMRQWTGRLAEDDARTASEMEKHAKKLEEAKKRWAAEAAAARAKQAQAAAQPQATPSVALPGGNKVDQKVLDQAERAHKAMESLEKVNVKKLMATADMIKRGGLVPAMNAIKQMVDLSNELDRALGDEKLNKLNIAAKLKNVANAVGLGHAASYKVQNKDVQITVNLTVTMNASELEKVIIQRKESVIRDRLINASYVNPSGPSDIPNTVNSPPPLPIGPKQ
jgi:hypothetical protein